MYRRISAVALSLFCLVAALRAQQAPPPEALDGVDVVTLITTGKEVFGKSAHRSTYEGFDYLFAGPETKAAFDKEPARYAIQLGGACARMGGLVTGNPADYAIHDGKIYIFGSDECHKAFVADPDKFMPPVIPMETSPDSIARGRALLDAVAAAHGGPALDAATSYAEELRTVQNRPMGDIIITTRNMWRFPGGARSERVVPMGDTPMVLTTVVTQSDAWNVARDGRALHVRPALRPAADAMLNRRLLPLLKWRKEAGVTIAALEPVTVQETRVERVRIRRGGVDAILNIDPASRRAHSLSFVDRGDQGHFGEIVLTFSDFRDVQGVLVPFSESATFKGTPNAALSRKLDSATLNVPLDKALFTPAVEK
jgi:YHS domain-containing protein